MVFAVFEFLVTIWPLSAVLLVMISYSLGRPPRSWWRHALRLLLVLLAPLLLLLEGLVSGCAFQPQGERCYWYGFGLTIAVMMIVPASALLMAIGAFAARWPKRGPKRD